MIQFHDEHRMMTTLAEGIMVAARDASEGSGERLSKLRLQLSRAVIAHVKGELATLNTGGQALPPEIMRRYHDELLDWRRALMDVNVAWPPARIRADPGAFVAAFRPLVKALRARIAWEEGTLYPAFKRAA